MGDPSSVPIFVIGMLRSGTTLVEQIVASHRDVYGGGELKILKDIVNMAHRRDGSPVPYPNFIASVDGEALRTLGASYVAELRKLAPHVRHVTDKMPQNFYFAGLIHLALPNARIIHVVRDPLDTCISCFSTLFGPGQSYTSDLGELGRYYRRYKALMSHWHRVLPKGRIIEVRYEDIVNHLEKHARLILTHCGLDWDPHCLDFYQINRPVRTASAKQVRQPIYKHAIGRWRVYEAYLGPLLTELE
jgi:Sulfotransferase family